MLLELWKHGRARAKIKDPFGSRKSPVKEEGLSVPQSHSSKAGTFGQEGANDDVPGTYFSSQPSSKDKFQSFFYVGYHCYL